MDAEWAEPRWSSSGKRIAAIQLLPNGVQRVVILDTLGALMGIVAESRAVMATPSFGAASSNMLVWTSDRSGRMQIETANVAHALTERDTVWRADVRTMLNVQTGVYHPVISVDNLHLAALLFRNNGFEVAVAKFDTLQNVAVADTGWYSSKRYVPDTTATFMGASTSYRALRQLWPRYWQPVIGQARDGGANYGGYTSSADILGRHSYVAEARTESAQWGS